MRNLFSSVSNKNLHKGVAGGAGGLPPMNYYLIADQIDKLSVSVFKNLSSDSFEEIVRQLFKYLLFI
jgi:hypothetical protein